MRGATIGVKTWVVVAAVLAVALTAAAGGKWILLGERLVDDRLDHDTILVGADRGAFSAVQVKVRKRAVEFRDMKVYFANGVVQDVELRQVIPAGGASRVIDLRGDDRVITSVEFWYDAQTAGAGKKSVVRLFGRR